MNGNLKVLEKQLLRKRREAIANPDKGMVNIITFVPREAGKPDFNTMITVIDDLENGTLTLMVENVRLLSIPRFDALVDFCTEFMGKGPSCSYQVEPNYDKVKSSAETQQNESVQENTELADNPEALARIREAEMMEREADAKKPKTSRAPITIITWCAPFAEDLHLRVVVNSDGLVGNCYNNFQLFGGHEKSEYCDHDLRKEIGEIIAARNATTLEPVPASLIA